MSSPDPPMKSVQFAFEIIDELQELGDTGPAELAREMDIPKSTAHAYLRTLQSSNYVINDEGEYRLSHKFLSMSSKLKNQNELVQAATKELENLAGSTEELTTLVIEEGGRAVVVHIEKGEQAIDIGIYPGITTPLHSHATGKTILAHMPKERYEEIVEYHGLKRVTAQTITEENQLQEELTQIREKGYGVDWDQQIKGMGVIAVPVIIEEKLVGAIGIACPTERIKNAKYRETLLRKLQETNESISIKYRYGS